jgi:hypothetical protein
MILVSAPIERVHADTTDPSLPGGVRSADSQRGEISFAVKATWLQSLVEVDQCTQPCPDHDRDAAAGRVARSRSSACGRTHSRAATSRDLSQPNGRTT